MATQVVVTTVMSLLKVVHLVGTRNHVHPLSIRVSSDHRKNPFNPCNLSHYLPSNGLTCLRPRDGGFELGIYAQKAWQLMAHARLERRSFGRSTSIFLIYSLAKNQSRHTQNLERNLALIPHAPTKRVILTTNRKAFRPELVKRKIMRKAVNRATRNYDIKFDRAFQQLELTRLSKALKQYRINAN